MIFPTNCANCVGSSKITLLRALLASPPDGTELGENDAVTLNDLQPPLSA